MAIGLAVIGFVGGLWLWRKIAESPVFAGMQRCLKVVGIFVTTALFLVTGYLFWRDHVAQSTADLAPLVPRINVLSWFLCFYMFGYDVSIASPASKCREETQTQTEERVKCRLNWPLIKRAALYAITAIAPSFLALLLISWKVFSMWAAGVVTFTLGFLFWEHLKETGMITGTFKTQLVVLSILTTGVIAFIVVYGVVIKCGLGTPEMVQTLVTSAMLFCECMAWYMLALCVAVFTAKK